MMHQIIMGLLFAVKIAGVNLMKPTMVTHQLNTKMKEKIDTVGIVKR